jgi:hypothetical protein
MTWTSISPTNCKFYETQCTASSTRMCKQHFLNLRPLPHGQGSFRPTVPRARPPFDDFSIASCHRAVEYHLAKRPAALRAKVSIIPKTRRTITASKTLSTSSLKTASVRAFRLRQDGAGENLAAARHGPLMLFILGKTVSSIKRLGVQWLTSQIPFHYCRQRAI